MASRQVERKASSTEVNQVQYGTRATMNNTTKSSLMKLDRSINWFGHPSTGAYPLTIPHNANSKFTHVRDGQFGSMAAVQYSGPAAPGSQAPSDPSAYILAWLAPADNTKPLPPNKVYVACGTKRRMDNISWEQVLANLEQSSTESKAHDSYSKTYASAEILDNIPNTANLISKFGYMD